MSLVEKSDELIFTNKSDIFHPLTRIYSNLYRYIYPSERKYIEFHPIK